MRKAERDFNSIVGIDGMVITAYVMVVQCDGGTEVVPLEHRRSACCYAWRQRVGGDGGEQMWGNT